MGRLPLTSPAHCRGHQQPARRPRRPRAPHLLRPPVPHLQPGRVLFPPEPQAAPESMSSLRRAGLQLRCCHASSLAACCSFRMRWPLPEPPVICLPHSASIEKPGVSATLSAWLLAAALAPAACSWLNTLPVQGRVVLRPSLECVRKLPCP